MTEASVNAQQSPPPVPQRGARMDPVIRVLTMIALVAWAVQFLLAGLGAFGGGFEMHVMLGRSLGFFVLLPMIAVLIARPSRAEVLIAILVAVLAFFGQTFLATLGTQTSSWFGALHVVNGVAIGGLLSRLMAGATGRQKRRQQAG